MTPRGLWLVTSCSVAGQIPCLSLSRGIFFVELGGATRANRTRDRFLGSSKVKKDGILASVSGVGFRFVFVCGAVEPASRHGAGELDRMGMFQSCFER